MRFYPFKLGLIALFSTVAAAGFGQSLFSVPTGDTLPSRTLSLDLELDGGPMLRGPRTLTITTLRYGVCDALTVGEDFQFAGTVQAAPNFSLRLYSDRRFAIAGGYENVGVRSFGEQPYLTGSYRTGPTRFHVGWTRSSHHSLMLGAEYAATKDLSLIADTITGRDNFTTAGLQLALSRATSLTAGFMHANDRINGDGLFLDFNFTYGTH